MSAALITLDGKNYFADPGAPHAESEQKALEFFWRAQLGETLHKIWDLVKRLPVGLALKLVKAVALVSAVILLSQSISVVGFLGMADSIAGLLYAAVTNVLVWLIYIPMYFVSTPDFASSAILALGLAWLGGITPIVALVFSPLVLFGLRLLERSALAQQHLGEVLSAVEKKVGQANLGARIQQAANEVARFVGSVLPTRPA